MNIPYSKSLSILCVLCFLLGCGQSSNPVASNPAPAVTSLSPATAVAGNSALTVTITGSGFISSSSAVWNTSTSGSSLSTTYVSSTSLTAQVPASLLTAPGTASIAVTTPAPGGGTSSALSFTISTPPNPAPTISSLSPSTALAGSPALTLTVTGSDFISSSQILWNNSPLTTTFVSSTSLTAQVPASDLASTGTSSIAVETPAPGGGTSSTLPFTIAAQGAGLTLNTLPIEGNDLAWDAVHGKLYVSVPSTSRTNPGTITAVDPVAASVSSMQQLNTAPSGLAISSDDQFLYSVVNSAGSIQRLTLPSLAPDIQWAIGAGSGSTPNVIGEIQVQPGAPHTIAASFGQYGSGSVAVFDDAVARPSISTNSGLAPSLASSLQWKADGTELYNSMTTLTDSSFYTTGSDIAVIKLPVTSSGVGAGTSLESAFQKEGTRLLSDPATGYLYSTSGEALNPATGEPVGWLREYRGLYSNFTPGPLAVVDSTLSRFFKLDLVQLSDNTRVFRVQSFDLKTFQHLGTINITGVTGDPSAFVRWGNTGLAIATSFISASSPGELCILDGAFVDASSTPDSTTGTTLVPVPVLTGLAPLTATVGASSTNITVSGRGFAGQPTVFWNGTALPTTLLDGTHLSAQVPASNLASTTLATINVSNSSSAQASDPLSFAVDDPVSSGNQLSVLDVGGNDIAWNSASAHLFVSVPGVQGDNGDAIATVDPAAGTISYSNQVGSEPAALSIASDGQSLYVGMNAQNAIQQLSLPNLAPIQSWNIGGTTTFGGPYYPLDLRAAPAAPGTTAVTLAQFQVSPSAQGVVIYDGSTPRPELQNGYYTYSGLEWGASDSILYALDQSVPQSFLELNVSASGPSLGQHFDNLFSSFNSRVHFDSTTGLVYAESGDVVKPSDGSIVGNYGVTGLVAVDATLGRTFFLGQTTAQYNTSNYTLEAFDQTKFTALGSITIENVVGRPTGFVRWGTNGLAFTTRSGNPWDFENIGPGHLYLVSGEIVQPTQSTQTAAPASLPPVRKTWPTPRPSQKSALPSIVVHKSSAE